MLFSQREGFEERKIQISEMDEKLRNLLWNELYNVYFNTLHDYFYLRNHKEIYNFYSVIWGCFLKKPLHEMGWSDDVFDDIRNYFFNCEWHEIFDLIELIYSIEKDPERKTIDEKINFALDLGLSGWRLIEGEFKRIIPKDETEEIKQAIENSPELIQEHLKTALKHLTDRKNPDFRNSIKESILAVEAICRKISNNEKATLGDALKEIENKTNVKIHGALKKAFSQIYGYTSEEEGIRHALIRLPNLDFEDARFMLVSCSAFINYLIVKAQKAEIELK